MPLTSRPGQSRHLDAHHDADVGQTDLRRQPLEAGPGLGAGRRVPQVLVDHQDPGRLPAQLRRSARRPVLQPRRLAVLDDLRHRGLAEVKQPRAGPGGSPGSCSRPTLTAATLPLTAATLRCSSYLSLSALTCPARIIRTISTAIRHSAPTRLASSSSSHAGAGSSRTRLTGHGSPCMHSAPSSPGLPSPSRSRTTVTDSPSKPSIPITGKFPPSWSSMHAFRFAP
jgi:hypothetical protein